jgi:hypothetical protein
MGVFEMTLLDGAVVLLLTYVMPPDKPDIHHQQIEESLDECFADEREFLATGIPQILLDKGALRKMAACMVKDTPRT